MSEIVLGIDPGAHGAIAVLDQAGKLLDVWDMPNTPEANGRFLTNAPLLSEILAKSHAAKAFCEFVGPRPSDGIAGAFAFGRARGIIEGCCAALNIPIEFMTPPQWKRHANVPTAGATRPEMYANKQVARTRAIAKWPDKAGLFQLATRVDRAEAALIAAAGLAGVTLPPPRAKAKPKGKAGLPLLEDGEP